MKESGGTRFAVGILLAELSLPGSVCLKDKRRVVKSLKDRLHNEFNVSVAEVGYLDAWQMASLAVAVVSNERSHSESVLAVIARKLDGDPNFFVSRLTTEFF